MDKIMETLDSIGKKTIFIGCTDRTFVVGIFLYSLFVYTV